MVKISAFYTKGFGQATEGETFPLFSPFLPRSWAKFQKVKLQKVGLYPNEHMVKISAIYPKGFGEAANGETFSHFYPPFYHVPGQNFKK